MQPISRRRLFALAAAASAVLALPAHAGEEADFDADDEAILRALLRTFYGPGPPDVLPAITESLRYLDADKVPDILALPGLLDGLSRVLVPTWKAWTSLDEAEQLAALEDWAASPLAFRRTVHAGLRQLLLSHAYLDPVTWPEFGYPGPWLGRLHLPVHPLRFGDIS